MGRSKKLWFKANRYPVVFSRALEIKEAHKGRDVDIVLVGYRMRRRHFLGDIYDVYVRRKAK